MDNTEEYEYVELCQLERCLHPRPDCSRCFGRGYVLRCCRVRPQLQCPECHAAHFTPMTAEELGRRLAEMPW